MRLIFLMFVLLFTVNAGCVAVEDDREMIWEFAWNLIGERAYFEAAGEYQRFQFCYPNDSRVEISEFMVAYCHMRGRQFQRANELWQRFLVRFPNSLLAELASFLSMDCAINEDWLKVDWKELLSNLKENGSALHVATYFCGWHLLEQGAWDAGKSRMRDAARMSALPEISTAAHNVLDEPTLISPPVIKPYRHWMGLSKWLPGLGQWSLGNHSDAVKSLIVNAGTAAIAYRWWYTEFRLGAAFMAYQGTYRFYKGSQYNAGIQAINRNKFDIDRTLAPLLPENEKWSVFEVSMRTYYAPGSESR